MPGQSVHIRFIVPKPKEDAFLTEELGVAFNAPSPSNIWNVAIGLCHHFPPLWYHDRPFLWRRRHWAERPRRSQSSASYLTFKLAQLAAIPAVPLPRGLGPEDVSPLVLFDDLNGLMTVLIALFRRFGVLLKLNARLTAIRVFDASLKQNRKLSTKLTAIINEGCT